MKIDNKDLFHGAALTQIVEHPSFKALNKADNKYGHYLVNANRRLLVKHSEANGTSWQFTFNKDDLGTLKADIDAGFDLSVVLVCAKKTVCLMNAAQVKSAIDLDANTQQWIRVKIPTPGSSLHVHGSKGELRNTIAHNSFPDKLF